nr:HD domain-containing phosphohydrolase [uncultured Undibacterium sp.]
MQNTLDKDLILAVDDEPGNLHLLREILDDQYRLLCAKDGRRALELAREKQPALILLDVVMPDMDGYEVCRQLKADPATSAIPVIFITSRDEADNELHGFELGAVDYITKPVNPKIVLARVKTHLSLVSVNELKESRLQIVQRLGLAAEYKDNETGLHVVRMSHYARLLGLAAGLSEAIAEDLLNAAPMHDVGKIGIPDSILRKPGKLDAEEWAIMQTHATIGANIMGHHKCRILSMAREIALEHHEKFDGTGYPNGLQGEQIQLIGRIVAIADVFDALTSERPYKKAWPVEEALAYLVEQKGKHFDPNLVDLFMTLLPQIEVIRTRWAEHV